MWVLWTRKVLWALGGHVAENPVMVSIAANGLNLGKGLRPFVRRLPRPNHRAMPGGGVLNLPFTASVAILAVLRHQRQQLFMASGEDLREVMGASFA